jgi:hypothetical protein
MLPGWTSDRSVGPNQGEEPLINTESPRQPESPPKQLFPSPSQIRVNRCNLWFNFPPLLLERESPTANWSIDKLRVVPILA